MNNIEESLKANVALSDLIGPDELTVTVSVLSALISQLEAAQRDRDLHYRVSEEFRIELNAAEAVLSAANEKLKGGQVPVAVIVLSKNWPDTGRKVIDYYLEEIQHLPVGTELFTAAPQPAGFTVDGE